MKKSRSVKANQSKILPIALGFLTIWGIFFSLSLIFAIILFSGDDPTGSTDLFSLISFMAAAAIASLINKRIFKSCAANAPLLSALLSALVYLLISAVASGKISMGCIISAACFILIAALASIQKKKKVKRHKR